MNKNKIPPAPPKSPVPGALPKKLAVPKTNGYSPKYAPSPEPAAAPTPKIETKVDVPAVLETTSLNDVVDRILCKYRIEASSVSFSTKYQEADVQSI
jgi:hypothetical protein